MVNLNLNLNYFKFNAQGATPDRNGDAQAQCPWLLKLLENGSDALFINCSTMSVVIRWMINLSKFKFNLNLPRRF